MATRKTFQRVAQALRLTYASHDTIVAVGLALSVDNPRFNLDKFVEASKRMNDNARAFPRLSPEKEPK